MLMQQKDLLRERYVITHKNSNQICINKKNLINFCSSDYLNIGSHTQVKKAFIQGVEQYGLGSGSSALISGYHKPHQMLEDQFADFLQRDKAIYFNSGYHANIGIIRTLVSRHGNIVVDKFCHASIVDGIQLSRANYSRYLHNDINHLERIINQVQKSDLLITESVFSMEGNISPIDKIVQIAQTHKINLMVDDAHGIGVLGKHGRGITEHYNLSQQDIPCLVVPLGKAFASMGAIVAGSNELIECITQFARSYCYSTALPPAIAQASMACLKIVADEDWRRQKLRALIQLFVTQAKRYDLTLISNDLTPIKSIFIGNNTLALKIKQQLMENGFFISCIRSPSVPKNSARIRISLNCMHTEENIIQLLDLIANAHEQFK